MSRPAPRRAQKLTTSPKKTPKTPKTPKTSTTRRATTTSLSPTAAVALGLIAGAGGILAAAAGGWLLYTCLSERIRLLDRDVDLLSRDAKTVRATLASGAEHARDSGDSTVVELPAPARDRVLRV